MSQLVERNSFDLRYQTYRLRNDAAEARLLASIAERVIDSVPWLETYIGAAKCGWNPDSAGADTYDGWTVPCWLAPAAGAALPFVDVDFSMFYIEGVTWLWSNSITTGTTATTFSPDDSVTRGQVAAFLWRFAGEPAAAGNPFSDVTLGWQLIPVAWLTAWDFTTGTTATTFSPDDSVSRAQLRSPRSRVGSASTCRRISTS